MPEIRKNAKSKCYKCKKVYGKNQHKCKVCKCHSITYCGEECQREDWPRHIDNHVTVMVKDYGEKGQGLVAAKVIKMGGLILTDKAVVANDDIDLESFGYTLTYDAARLLINQRILKDISLLNHSCAPNAAIGLLDGESNREPEKRFELRAIKDISKEEEVTICYRRYHFHSVMRQIIQEEFGFDCKCPELSGEVPNQDDIARKITDILISSYKRSKESDEMTLSDWTRRAISYGAIVELAKPVYMGRPEGKMVELMIFLRAAAKARKPALIEKAVDRIKELAEKTGLEVFKKCYKENCQMEQIIAKEN